MTFTVGCRWLDSYKQDKTFTFEKETAAEVLAEAKGIEQSDACIEYVDTPERGRLDMHGFRTLYGKR
jgi:hypothetical protein